MLVAVGHALALALGAVPVELALLPLVATIGHVGEKIG